jgi:hypothetical protein
MNNNMNHEEFTELLLKFREPFDLSDLSFRPMIVSKDKKRAMAAVYADPRAYEARLDEVYPAWECTYSIWGNDRIICHLTIAGVTRSSTGEMDKQSETQEIGGTAAEAQAFKRSCTKFGMGRYLYEIDNKWAEYDEAKRAFTDQALMELRRHMTTITKALQLNPTKRKPTSTTSNGNGNGDGEKKTATSTRKPPATSKPTTTTMPPELTPDEEEATEKATTSFALTQEQALAFQKGVKDICGDKSQGLLTEACKTLGFTKFSEVDQDQWDILSYWLEQMEEEEKPFRLSQQAVQYAKDEIAKKRGEVTE